MNAIDFDAIVFREGSTFVAHCPELDVSSCGDNLEEARKNLKTAVRLFLEESEKMGTLEDILKESGYQQGADSNGHIAQRQFPTQPAKRHFQAILYSAHDHITPSSGHRNSSYHLNIPVYSESLHPTREGF